MKRIYLDYAATTPVDPAVEKAMRPYFTEGFGNPGSLHYFGRQAMAAVDEAREKIAKAVGAPPAGGFREIIFTGSATEANNLALRGIARAFRVEGLGFSKTPNLTPKRYTLNPRIIVSFIEHESILETCKDLETTGIEVVYLPVDKNGAVDLKKLKSALNERTILISVMYANNEIGVVQPIVEIANIISDFRKQIAKRKVRNVNDSRLAISAWPLFHTDAVQAFQYLNCDVNKLSVDLMTLSAHKIYGPKGIGALYQRLAFRDEGLGNKKSLIPKRYTLHPIITGGGQEFGFRSGTENVPAIVGFAKAVELAVKNREKESRRIAGLKSYFWHELKKNYPETQLNIGGNQLLDQRPSAVLPNILNVYFPGHEAQDLLTKFDLAGIAASSGSACSARSIKPSHVLGALGYPEKRIKSSIRFSLGRPTAKVEIDEVIKKISLMLKRARK